MRFLSFYFGVRKVSAVNEDRRAWQRREDFAENVVWGVLGVAAVLLLLWAVSFNIRAEQQVVSTGLTGNSPTTALPASGVQ